MSLFKYAFRNSQSAILLGVWCNASIRVLGTRGDSSILSSPTKVIADCQLPISNWLVALHTNRQSEINNRQCFCSCSSTGRVRRFERRGCGFESCQEFH